MLRNASDYVWSGLSFYNVAIDQITQTVFVFGCTFGLHFRFGQY